MRESALIVLVKSTLRRMKSTELRYNRFSCMYCIIGPVKQKFEHKNAIIFLPSNLNIRLGAQKNRLIETVLLSTHNICFE